MSRGNFKVDDMIKDMFNFQPPKPGSTQSKVATIPLLETHMEATRLNWVRQQNVIRDNYTSHGYPLPLPPEEPSRLVNNSVSGSGGLSGWQGDSEVFPSVNGLGKFSREPTMEYPWKNEVILLDEPDDDVVLMESTDAETDNMIEELAKIPREQEQTPSRKRLNPSEDLSLQNAKRVAFEHAGFYNQPAASNSNRREKGRKKMKSLQELMSQSANQNHCEAPTGHFQMPPLPVPLPLPNANQLSDRVTHQGQMVETRAWLKIRLPAPSTITTSYPLPHPEQQFQAPTMDNGGRGWRSENDFNRLVKRGYRSPHIT